MLRLQLLLCALMRAVYWCCATEYFTVVGHHGSVNGQAIAIVKEKSADFPSPLLSHSSSSFLVRRQESWDAILA
jgi:hypothetical protein